MLLLTLLACTPEPPPSDQAPPAVVLVVVDTVRADRLQPWGGPRPTSPTLEALLPEAVRYERVLSQAPWTTPSIGSILTSRYPESLGIDRYKVPIPDSALTLAEVFRQAGWSTGAVVSHDYCSSKWAFDQGFDYFDESSIGGPRDESSTQVTRLATRFVDAHLREPFFLWVHYFDPHFAYLDHGQPGFEPDPRYTGPIRSGLGVRELRQLIPGLGPADVEALLRIYDSELAHTDAAVGQLLAHLRARHRWEHTTLAWTADHGEEFLDHGRWGHTVTLYQELVHVPLLIRYPDQAHGVVSTRVANLDIAPTLLHSAGVEVPEAMQGLDLRGELPAHRPLFTSTSKGAQLRGVVRDEVQLIRDLRADREALYDLSADPGQTEDLRSARPEEAAALGALLDAHFAGLHPTSAPQVELDSDERARLEALGYVDGP